MRVGYVLKRYPRLSETFIANELRGIEAHGVEATVLALGFPFESRIHPVAAQVKAPCHYLAAANSTAGRTRSLDVLDIGDAAIRSRLNEFLQGLDPRYRFDVLVHGLDVADHVRSQNIDRLHAHFVTVASHVAYVAHVVTGVPFTVTAHAKDIFRDGIDVATFRTVAEAASALVTVSDYNVAWIRDRLIPDASVHLARIYNGIDVSGFAPTATGARDRHTLLAVGRLVEKKGFDVALRTLATAPAPTRLVVIGDGELRGRLEGEAQRLSVADRVEFLGAQTSDVVAQWMSRATALVAPFTKGADGNQDALPTVLVEALASGLPVVATHVAGVPEIIQHGQAGLITPDADTDAFTEAVGRILDDPTTWWRRAFAASTTAADRFDLSATIPQLLDVWGVPRRAESAA